MSDESDKKESQEMGPSSCGIGENESELVRLSNGDGYCTCFLLSIYTFGYKFASQKLDSCEESWSIPRSLKNFVVLVMD